MPRKQPVHHKRSTYSEDLKSRVIYQAEILGKSSTEIAISLNMTVRVVQRVRKTWKDTGKVCKNRKHMGRAPIISPHEIEFMLALLDHSPDIYLDEIQAQLSEMHSLDVSLATIYRTLKRLGIGSKKLSKAATERSEEARRTFRLEIGAEPPERIVTADESAVNILTTYRQNGWSYRGIRARKKCKFVRGTRYSLLPAISIDGIIYSDIKIGGYNGDEFMAYLDGLTTHMNPYPGPRSVLVIDNCRIHHVEGVQELCDERCGYYVFTRRYQ